MKAVVIGALAATAFSKDTLSYVGQYAAPATGRTATSAGDVSAVCCYPTADGVKVEETATAGTYKLSWTYAADTQGCVAAEVATGTAGGSATGTGAPNTDGDIKVTALTKEVTLDAPTSALKAFTLDLDKVTSTAKGCKVALAKNAPTTAVTYAGVYKTTKLGTSATCCYPEDDVIIKPTGTTDQYSFEWTFDDSSSCYITGAVGTLKGTKVTGTATVKADGSKDIDLVTRIPTASADTTWNLNAAPLTSGQFTLDLSGMYTGGTSDCGVSLERRTLPTTLTYP